MDGNVDIDLTGVEVHEVRVSVGDEMAYKEMEKVMRVGANYADQTTDKWYQVSKGNDDIILRVFVRKTELFDTNSVII